MQDQSIKQLSLLDVVAEEWRAVVGYEGLYEVSSLGRVKRIFDYKNAPRRIGSGYIHRCSVNVTGYVIANLRKDNIAHMYNVHRLVAFAFLKTHPDRPIVNHLNAIKSDNRVENLEWSTYRGNSQHAEKMGLLTKRNRGEQSWASKLTVSAVREIRSLAGVLGRAVLAKRFGVSKYNITQITRGYTWQHVDPGYKPSEIRAIRRTYNGTQNPAAKLTEEKVLEIVRRRSNGETLKTLSGEFGVSPSTIHLIMTGRKWTSVTHIAPHYPQRVASTAGIVSTMSKENVMGIGVGAPP